jgi:5-deoxy-D-glucuronate isomerase
MPYINRIFKDAIEAENYLNEEVLQLHKVIQSNYPPRKHSRKSNKQNLKLSNGYLLALEPYQLIRFH